MIIKLLENDTIEVNGNIGGILLSEKVVLIKNNSQLSNQEKTGLKNFLQERGYIVE